eukprot:270439_1
MVPSYSYGYTFMTVVQILIVVALIFKLKKSMLFQYKCSIHIIFIILLNLLFLSGNLYCIQMLFSRVIGTPNVLKWQQLNKHHHQVHLSPHNRKTELGKLLSLWHNISLTYNLTYCIVSSSLLSKYRNNNFIDWEKDIDVAITNASASHFIDLYHNIFQQYEFLPVHNNVFLIKGWKYIPKQYWKQLNIRTDYALRFKRREPKHGNFAQLIQLYSGIYMDLEHLETCRTPYKTICMNQTNTKQNIFPIQNCQINGINTLCPNKIENVLNFEYYNNLYPPFIKTNWTVIWFIILLFVTIIHAVINVYIYTHGYKIYKCRFVMLLILFVVIQLLITCILFVVICVVFCWYDYPDKQRNWCINQDGNFFILS